MKTFLQWTGRLILAGIFLYAAIPKIADPAGFAKSVFNYQILPDGLINLLALYLPWLESIGAAALLFVAPLRRGATALIALMLVVFMAAMGSAMARGINIDCGCFSTSGQGLKAGGLHLLLDLALLAIALALLRAETAADRSPRAA